jgi:hypothetical protein
VLASLLAAALFAPGSTSLAASRAATASPRYVVLAWNDLGMHCYNGSFADMVVLPPYNTLWAQVVEVADPPRVVTAGVTVSYEVPGNTSSATKTDFWQYATQAFGLATPLPPNVGLTGKGLSGAMDASGDHFVAAGIPLTEYTDSNPTTRTPFQQALITVRDSTSGAVIATAAPVIPVSSEMGCASCHADGADATTRYPITPTGDFQRNILALHDYLSASKYPAGHTAPLAGRRPILCAECHADAALGAPGIKGISNLSNAMHRHHNPINAPDITPDTDGCYMCHPGAQTQCLRCVMSQQFGMGCVDCHGDITKVATNPAPWANEPKCSNSSCHGAGYTSDKPLYRNSVGHGDMYCAACHDSPHAIATSREPADAAKFVDLQGKPGTLRSCTVCHLTMPAAAFKHAATAKPTTATIVASTVSTKVGRPFVLSGALTPCLMGDPCVVDVRKPGSARWSYSSTRLVYTASGGSGSWWYRYVPKVAGTHAFRVRFTGMTGRMPCCSAGLSVRVR